MYCCFPKCHCPGLNKRGFTWTSQFGQVLTIQDPIRKVQQTTENMSFDCTLNMPPWVRGIYCGHLFQVKGLKKVQVHMEVSFHNGGGFPLWLRMSRVWESQLTPPRPNTRPLPSPFAFQIAMHVKWQPSVEIYQGRIYVFSSQVPCP